MEMDVSEYIYRSKLKEVVKARNLLDLLNVQSYTKMNEKSQSKYYKTLQQRAFPEELNKAPQASNEEAFGLFKRMASGR